VVTVRRTTDIEGIGGKMVEVAWNFPFPYDFSDLHKSDHVLTKTCIS